MKITALVVATALAATSVVATDTPALRALADAPEADVQPNADVPLEGVDQQEWWGRPGWGRPGWGWGRPGWGRPGWGWGRPGWGWGKRRWCQNLPRRAQLTLAKDDIVSDDISKCQEHDCMMLSRAISITEHAIE
ncbi:hypothetical protein F442_10152 [Phytophthora nicotianae P10297]|uniref:RxLR effector protein n=3 Tax=Phytophthora nicotianae TaxID=4792 RepID=W2RAH1_PHYN3|nr:hypothetical protein PPTG_21097 [Phytophthora nicotianae INRA-310]ETL91618.1 hypothetical protein L917_09854 [Phytophthora nicotianae]ETN21545.1 hypothetical protein PPTG_21097 [Phytophthora nicotianae INRA-310]ETP43003.1 hypothetical protein F442_10152 [Phytophthora nicotianae P10297]